MTASLYQSASESGIAVGLLVATVFSVTDQVTKLFRFPAPLPGRGQRNRCFGAFRSGRDADIRRIAGLPANGNRERVIAALRQRRGDNDIRLPQADETRSQRGGGYFGGLPADDGSHR